jgi:hypothetical protein
MSITKLDKQDYAQVGELISEELGAKMVKNFQDKYPDMQTNFSIGREIIEKILSQPGCAGLRLFNSMDDQGNVSLVYIAVDHKGRTIDEYTVVEETGQLTRVKAMIGDDSTPVGTGKGGYNWFS